MRFHTFQRKRHEATDRLIDEPTDQRKARQKYFLVLYSFYSIIHVAFEQVALKKKKHFFQSSSSS